LDQHIAMIFGGIKLQEKKEIMIFAQNENLP